MKNNETKYARLRVFFLCMVFIFPFLSRKRNLGKMIEIRESFRPEGPKIFGDQKSCADDQI